MSTIRSAHRALWGVYALLAVTHLGALLGDGEMLARLTQPLFAPVLIAVLLTALLMVISVVYIRTLMKEEEL